MGDIRVKNKEGTLTFRLESSAAHATAIAFTDGMVRAANL